MKFLRIWAAAALVLLTGIEVFQALYSTSGDVIGLRLVTGLYLSAWGSVLMGVVVALLAIVFHKSEA